MRIVQVPAVDAVAGVDDVHVLKRALDIPSHECRHRLSEVAPGQFDSGLHAPVNVGIDGCNYLDGLVTIALSPGVRRQHPVSPVEVAPPLVNRTQIAPGVSQCLFDIARIPVRPRQCIDVARIGRVVLQLRTGQLQHLLVIVGSADDRQQTEDQEAALGKAFAVEAEPCVGRHHMVVAEDPKIENENRHEERRHSGGHGPGQGHPSRFPLFKSFLPYRRAQ